MTLHLPIRGASLLRPGVALFCLLAPLSLRSNLSAQDHDVAEAARQQQAQNSQQPSTPHHVYTDVDLKRARILTPEDKKLAEARRKELPVPTPAAKKPPAVDATNPPPESLGEVARRYRNEKAAREAEAAAAKKAPAPFRIELPSSTFAEPKPSVAPLLPPPKVAAPVVVAPSPAPPYRSAASPRVSRLLRWQRRLSSHLHLHLRHRTGPQRRPAFHRFHHVRRCPLLYRFRRA